MNEIKRLNNIIKELEKQLQQKESIIKEVKEILNNKREISVLQLIDRGYCDYEELLYQVDEEIRKILDKGDQMKKQNNKYYKLMKDSTNKMIEIVIMPNGYGKTYYEEQMNRKRGIKPCLKNNVKD